jgi:cysteine-rich repeat protein
LDDPGVGFIVPGGADHFYYFGQGQNCDVDDPADSCINVCSIDEGGVDCFPPRVLTGGSHVNGAVMVPNNNPSNARVAFLESNDASSERLLQVNRDCLETNQQDCPASLLANYAADDLLDPLGLDLDPFDGSLWWNTWGGKGATGACVYRYPSLGNLGQCLPTATPIPHPNRLAVSGPGVFVSTFTPMGEAGAIQRINRCTLDNGQHTLTEFSGVTWPADADGHFLYAAVLETPGALRVLDAHTGEAVTTLFDKNGIPISAVDASNPFYVLYSAGNRIYRWRKPTPPCADPPGAPVCGNGCIEQGEACDDGDDDPSDGCNACQCALP